MRSPRISKLDSVPTEFMPSRLSSSWPLAATNTSTLLREIQILHGSATTTEAIRRAIQHGQESPRALAKRYGINQKTVAKWKKRSSVADVPNCEKCAVADPKQLWSGAAAPSSELVAVDGATRGFNRAWRG